ncbi:MAG: AAA family ATPase [Pseudomonadota bacterium]
MRTLREARDFEEAPDPAEDGPHRIVSPSSLSVIARLAQAMTALHDAGAIQPGMVVIVRAERRTAPAIKQIAVDQLSKAYHAAVGNDVPWRMDLVDASDLGEEAPTVPEFFANALERSFRRGATVLLLLPPGVSVPDLISSMVLKAELTMPPLTPALVRAMLCACGTIPTDLVPGPGEAGPSASADYADLDLLHLIHAWNGKTAGEVIDRLDAAAEGVQRDRAAIPHKAEHRPHRIRLSDVHGLGPARRPLQQVVHDVHAWADGTLQWSEIGASFLLHGPPSVGKSMIAQALATEIGGPVLDLSYGTVQAAGHLGRMLAAMDAVVAQASKEAPCVVLVDEADDLHDRGHGSGDRNSSYSRSVVNGYLTRLSALAEVPGVVVILCTNFPERLDRSLIRAGRCDRRIGLGLPDAAARSAILSDALGGRAEDGITEASQWRDAIRSLAGATGADIALVARQAVALARGRDREGGGGTVVTADDIGSVICETGHAMQEVGQDVRRMALHEAGHLVVGRVLDRPMPTRAWIGPRGAGVEAPHPRVQTLATATADLTVLPAGRAAEKRLCRAVSSGAGDGPASDLATATHLARRINSEWQLQEDEVREWRSGDGAGPVCTRTVRRMLAEAWTKASDIVADHTSDIERIAAALQDERDLARDRLATLLEPIGRHGSMPFALMH